MSWPNFEPNFFPQLPQENLLVQNSRLLPNVNESYRNNTGSIRTQIEFDMPSFTTIAQLLSQQTFQLLLIDSTFNTSLLGRKKTS